MPRISSRFTPIALTSLALAAMAGGCAPTPPTSSSVAPVASARPCFNVSQVRGFQARDRDSVILETRMGQHYVVEAVGLCMGLDSAIDLGIQSDVPGLDRLCVGDLARLVLRDAAPSPTPCRARVVEVIEADRPTASTPAASM